ncbi:hypothetical protein UB44_10540 [Burkholderiaceae bacterium 26]|nr:hypothetical protein UB44_10540 [Burkholderiaceae bacterium 26]
MGDAIKHGELIVTDSRAPAMQRAPRTGPRATSRKTRAERLPPKKQKACDATAAGFLLSHL